MTDEEYIEACKRWLERERFLIQSNDEEERDAAINTMLDIVSEQLRRSRKKGD